MSEQVSGVVERIEDLDAAAVFASHRDQVILAVRITPVFNTLDLGLVADVIDAANRAGFALVRERSFRDEWLLCVFDAYDTTPPASPPAPPAPVPAASS
ncbi:conserved hypothetical protein [Frankia sp. AiPs1]|uniref:hypothetical protein n=1 Tax=Frankia sp. AiPa1 TaxID=573492 RepID=UPI00202B21DC|nr:hypothetical protein [Frankia sp. AiPa1]MCL9757985.1 hypothetical protein [Frankia sp. AiPa1]